MPLGSGGEVGIAYIDEVTFGTMPAGAKTSWRVTSRRMNAERDVLESAEIAADGLRSAGSHGRQQQVGRIAGEYGMNYQDHGIEWALGEAFTADGATGTQCADVVRTRRGKSITKQYGPTLDAHQQYKGCMPNSMTLRLAQGAIPTLEWDVRGKEGGALITPDLSAPLPAPTSDNFSPFTGTIEIGTLTGLLVVTALEVVLNRNISAPNVLFQRDPVDNLLGSISLSGRATLLADTVSFATLHSYGFTEQLVDMRFRLHGNTGGTIYHEWEIPAVKFFPATDDPGLEGEFPVEMTWRASPGDVVNSPSGTTRTLLRVRRKTS